ncbi:MAG: phage tail protein [Eubacteriales bacterium]|nr:phage tail protein [Eubacteriales bacterium]
MEQLLPRFLLNDKNGYAMARAIEAALLAMDATVETGLNCVSDVDTMPEWRLDEMAREYHCLYDFRADVEAKRRWIRLALPLYRLYGTPRAIYQYLQGFFESVEVEEGAAYEADAFHFRVTASGEAWTDATEAWARKAIETAKNVRSIFDNLAVGCAASIGVHGEGAEAGKIAYPVTGAELLAGTEPLENTVGAYADVTLNAEGEGDGTMFPYPQTGTIPDVNTAGAYADGGLTAVPATDSTVITYVPCGTATTGE